MNLYQKPKAILGKYKINEIAYFSQNDSQKSYGRSEDAGLYRAVGSQFGISICDAGTGEDLHLLPGTKNEVLSVACSPKGSMIAGGRADNTIELWTNWWDGAYHLKGHSDAVVSVVFSPNGEMLASGSNDGTIRLWDLSDRLDKSTLEHDGVTSVVFSPDGSILASGSNDGTIRLWESEIRFGQNRCITTLDEPKIDVYPTIFISDNSRKAVTSVVFSLNDSILASGYSDGTICLWDIRTLIPFVKRDSNEDRLFWYTNRDLSKNRITLEKKHTDSIQSLDFNSDGRTLASGSKDKTICIWDTKTSEHLATLKKHTNTVFSVVFQGKQPINEDKSLHAARSELTGIQGEQLVSENDSEQLVSESSDGSIRFWNTKIGKNERTLIVGYIDNNIESVVFSPSGQVLASIGKIDSEVELRTVVRFWDVNTSEIKSIIRSEIEAGAAHFSPDSRTFMIRDDDDDRYYRWGSFWDVNIGKMKTSIIEQVEDLEPVRFSPNGQILIDDSGTFWDIGTGEQKASIGKKIETFESVQFSPDSKTLGTVEKKGDPYAYSRSTSRSTESIINLWDINIGELKHSIVVKTKTVKSIQFSPDSKTLVINSPENIYLCDMDTGEKRRFTADENTTFKLVQFSPDSKKLTAVTTSKTYFWDIETGKFRNTRSTKRISNVESIVFSSDNRLLLSVSTNEGNRDDIKTKTFCFRDVETGEPIFTPPEEMTNNIKSIIFSSDKSKFASVHSDKLIRLWDVDTGKHQSTFEGAQEDISSVAFSLDNRTLACGCSNGMILLWEITK